MNALNVTIGADPEFFLRCHKTGQILSAIGRVGGSKKEPSPVQLGALQEDGVLAEINIHPASNVQEFIFNMESVMEALQGRVGPDIQLLGVSHAVLRDEDLQNPLAWEIGCDPDINAWTGFPNNTPRGYRDGRRVAGGHIHVGYEKPNDDTSMRIVQMMDYCVGLPSLLDEPDTFRRRLYGMAGSCRIKPYGVEYRALGNYWVNSAEHMATVYNRTTAAVANLHLLDTLKETLAPELLQDLINHGEDAAVISAYYQDIAQIIEDGHGPITL